MPPGIPHVYAQTYPAKPLASQGADVLTMSPEQFGQFIAKEKAPWVKVVKDSGAKFE